MPTRRRLAPLLALTVLGACGSAQAASREVGSASTLGGVGVLPVTVAAAPAAPRPPATSTTTTAPAADPSTVPVETVPAETAPVAVEDAPTGPVMKVMSAVGERAAGNRLLMIGDSIMAGTSSRYTNDMCKALVPLGWQVEVDAEVGRFIDFGDRVLDRRLNAGWDAAVIFLGSNFGDNQAVFASMLEEQVDRLSPRPVVLVTVTEFKPTRADVNAAIRLIAFNHPNVSVVDWATISATTPGVLSGDGLHPTPQGRHVLAMNVAAAVGEAPTQPGSCLKPPFRDDSAGSVVTGTTGPACPRTTTRPTPTTTKPATQPTARPTPTTADAPAATVNTTPKTNPAPVTTDAPKVTEPKPTSAPTSPPAAAPTTAGG